MQYASENKKGNFMRKLNAKEDIIREREIRRRQLIGIDEKKIEDFNSEADIFFKFLVNNDIYKKNDFNSKSLELGCGLGAFTFKIASMGYNVIGSDISKDQIDFNNERCKKNNMPQLFSVIDVNLLSYFPNNSFDYIFLIQTLHHIKNVDSIFDEIFRILKNNGKVIILECNTLNVLRFFSALIMKIDIKIFHGKLHLAPHLNEGFHFIRTYKKLISKYGNFNSYPYIFSAEENFVGGNKRLLGGYHYVLFAKILSFFSFSKKYYTPSICLVGENRKLK